MTKSNIFQTQLHRWNIQSNRAAVLNQFSHAILAASLKRYRYVTWWLSVMSQSHRVKGGTCDEEFQEQYFLWERGALLGKTFTFLTKQNKKNTEGKVKNEKAQFVSFNLPGIVQDDTYLLQVSSLFVRTCRKGKKQCHHFFVCPTVSTDKSHWVTILFRIWNLYQKSSRYVYM